MKTPSAAVGGKARNLATLSSIPGITVPAFTVMPATFSLPQCRATIAAFLSTNPDLEEVAVRSSALNEDAKEASFAGMYATKLRISANVEAILTAVEEVRQSGTRKKEVAVHYSAKRGLQPQDVGMAVIVQKMIHAELSGVIFSHGLDAEDGYYLVSTAHGLGEAVVSGSVNGQLIRVTRGANLARLREPWLRELIASMRIVEKHLGNESLDVEFAYENGTLHVLQCRPITTVPATSYAVSEQALTEQLEDIDAHIRAHWSGDVLGDMIDINPLELLGSNPAKLDISIFRHLFADTIVERARRKMGYDPLDVGLITEVSGKPYVSLRASAFSFRPSGIPAVTYVKLVDVYREMLVQDPGLQSRVEFAVFAMRCGKKLERLMNAAFLRDNEKTVVRQAFQRLDETLVSVSETAKSVFVAQATEYRQRTQSVLTSSLQKMLNHVAVGTELFVHVARLAFYWKNRFEEVYPGNDLNELLVGHIQSVSSRLQTDMFLCREGQLARDKLVERYGHLRPGQFSVFGESYADDPDHYLFGRIASARNQRIERRRHRYEETVEFKNVVVFMQAREEAKFLFSESLGAFITSLTQVLDARHIPRADTSQYDWKELWTLLKTGTRLTPKETASLPIILPEVIAPGHTDLGVVVSSMAAPSYITREVVKARVCVLDTPGSHADVGGALVLIPSADPGYDFLFHSGVTGIITKSGGPASHMCIRAVELQMPSCIGCGEQMYRNLSTAHSAVLDCKAGQIVIAE